MSDMLVKLYNVRPDHALTARLAEQQIVVVRALAPDTRRVVGFVDASADDHWPAESRDNWVGECTAALANNPPSCFIAIQHGEIIGFACYNATGKGFFGPTGVLRESRGKGVGTALLLDSLLAMWNEGYGYAIIGWPAPDAVGFYERTVHAQLIEDSSPGIYRRMVGLASPEYTAT